MCPACSARQYSWKSAGDIPGARRTNANSLIPIVFLTVFLMVFPMVFPMAGT
ncbi:unannotated protein [freshwater metagenome]|uniref:Unannotated protein n=1 Tax=freshwater metagenome TaxID=449393 RepID=A0A6J7JKS6_9ZZZZ